MGQQARVSGHGFLAWIEGEQGLICVDTGWDVGKGEPFEGSTLEAVSQASTASGKDVTHILLTHYHWDHVLNLPQLLERWPAVEVVAHPANSAASNLVLAVTAPTTFQASGVTITAMPTPGHSDRGDDVSYWLPEERFLFCGDIAQPQGPSYAVSSGPSPLPYFHDGPAYIKTLEQLLALDLNAMRTGHGDLLGPEQARQWLRVTYATVNRIADLAGEMVEKYPDQTVDWLCQTIYETVADERHVPFKEAQGRLSQVTYPELGLSDYELFDKPGIRSWVEVAQGLR
jgi:glyoxylase-like metal-dependent hydrolase (beta-lactamase superfamily II)